MSDAADFYTGLVARIYRHLRSETFDPAPYARFVERFGQPALELGCGDGDPILDLRERGLDVEGLDSSADMLAGCRRAAAERGLTVELHHATFQTMDLGRRYRSIYLAGGTFCLLPDDHAAQQALHRIAAHLQPGGTAMIPLFVPNDPDEPDGGPPSIGRTRAITTDDGQVMGLTMLSVEHDSANRLQTTRLRYDISDADGSSDTVEREWVLHWFEQQRFTTMVADAGLTVLRIAAGDGSRAAADARSFTFVVRLDDDGQDVDS
jgi:SAM-dependent methyltransferase